MKQHHQTIWRDTSKPRSGFTLTEMLVATALVVLIMLMFAQIYGSAVGSITEQRGLANNDQKARIAQNLLRKDLQALTYRQPSFPYGDIQGIAPIDNGDQPIIDPVNQRGYFFIAENNASLDTDDILQFTMQLQRGERGDVDDRGRSNQFVGKAANLGIANEAEKDDGIFGNGLGASSAAEVCYFLRGGNLYRRVLLLRDPVRRSALREDGQPTNGTSRVRRFRTGNEDYTGANFYTVFDYAATRRDGILWFHSVESLANDRGLSNWPIALPRNRFGFRPSDGASVENDSNGVYFGRFTHEETSDGNFNGYPGTVPSTANHPYERSDLEDTDGDYTLDQLAGGSRLGEDILLSNVEAFNIEVFFEGSSDFVNLPSNDVYDTFHPNASGSVPTEDFINTSALGTWTANGSPPSVLGVPVLSQNSPVRRSMIYVRTSGGTTGDVRPEFPPIPGNIVQDGSVTWECIDNRKPLKAIRVTIRFLDTRSGLVRQLSIVHSFVE